MKYIEKEIEPIHLLKDWWRSKEEYGEFVCEHDDFEKWKDGQEDE